MAWLTILTMQRTAAFALLSLLFAGFWFLAARNVSLPYEGSVAQQPIACLSYAPFERGQSPFYEALVIPPEQIERQTTALAEHTRCLRSYSVAQGLDALPAAAKRAGLKVLLGIWLGGDRAANEREIVRALELTRIYPDTIEALIVGNEVLLRKEMTLDQLAAVLDRVRAESALPVTYADVWENWDEAPELAEHVDFATIHILPYWEDHPVANAEAVAHVAEVRRAMGERLAGVDILIGETGWPAHGRQRQGAIPSPLAQAFFIHGVLSLFHEQGWRYNLIEAVDQDWKRILEGTVGGHWGVLDETLQQKFVWGSDLSDHALGILTILGLVLALAVQAIAPVWHGFALALVSGIALPWWLEQAPLVSLDLADWLRTGLAVLLSVSVPLLSALAMKRGLARPALASLLGAAPGPRGWLDRTLALGLVLALALTLPWALGLVFDPRYRDFMTAAVAPALAALALLPSPAGPQRAEAAFAVTLGLAAAITLANEGLQNGQSLLWCFTLGLFAWRLWPAPAPWRRAPA